MLIVMTKINFRQFSIILFFMAPMWALFAIASCLFVVRISKYLFWYPALPILTLIIFLADWDMVRARKVFDDLNLV